MPGSVAELIGRMRQGQRVTFLFFWGHQPERDGGIGQGYMMWRKAMLFADSATAEEILRASDPRRAKELGRGVLGFDQSLWEACRYEIVLAGSVAKFDQHADLRRFLLSTDAHVLVEASPMDRVWGIGLAADDPGAEDPNQWPGLNLLGFALTEARTLLS